LVQGAASLGSAYLGANAARDASRQQGQAADRAADATTASLGLQRSIYDQNRADLAPWRETGGNALAALYRNWGGDFRASPGYDFRRSEGLRAVEAGMAARGLSQGTARDRAAARFADGLASQEYDQWWNRGAGLAGVGQTATAQGVQAGQNYGAQAAQGAANLGAIYGQAGNAAAAGGIGQANAWGGALNNLANNVDWTRIAKSFG
jgi:hypothetical protein